MLIAGLAVRLALTPYGVFRSDAQTFRSWAVRLVDTPLSNFYAASGARAPDHLPVDLWFLWGIAQLYHHFSPTMAVQGFGFLFLLKLVPALADVGIGIVLYLIADRLAGPRAGLLAAGLWLLNPASIFLTATWGQWDSVSAFFMLAALWLVLRGSPEWALPVLTYATLIKPQMAALVPLALIAWWRWRILPPRRDAGPATQRRKHVELLAMGALASLVVFVVVAVPFNVGLPPLPTRWTIVDRMQFAMNRFQSVSENAYNLWTILGHAGRSSGVNDGQVFLLGLSYQQWGTLLLALTLLAIWALVWLRPTRSMVVWGSLATTFALFMLPTRIHERYLLPAVVLAVLVSAVAPHLRWLGPALSLSYLANIYAVYHQSGGGGFGGGGGVSDLVVLGVSAVNLFLFLAVIALGVALARQPAVAAEALPATIPPLEPLEPLEPGAVPARPPLGPQVLR
jgi:Gpi18-like mannosyltransferase